jgi:hypothetical protein
VGEWFRVPGNGSIDADRVVEQLQWEYVNNNGTQLCGAGRSGGDPLKPPKASSSDIAC